MIKPTDWYIVRTAPRAEQKAEEAITQNGYEFYCPKVKVIELLNRIPKTGTFRHPKLEKEIEEKPLYRGYAFARSKYGLGVIGMIQDQYGNRLSGVMGLVRFGNALGIISDQIINELKYVVEKGMLNEYSGSTQKRFEIGQQVKHKPTGVTGTVTGVDKRGIPAVVTELLGGKRPVVVSRLDELEAL